MAGGIGQFTGPIYIIALKLDPAKLGLIGSVPRFFDAIYDIWLGHFSDNTRTRWGRRRPFIAIGTLLSALFFRGDRMDSAALESQLAVGVFRRCIHGVLAFIWYLFHSVQRPGV